MCIGLQDADLLLHYTYTHVVLHKTSCCIAHYECIQYSVYACRDVVLSHLLCILAKTTHCTTSYGVYSHIHTYAYMHREMHSCLHGGVAAGHRMSLDTSI